MHYERDGTFNYNKELTKRIVDQGIYVNPTLHAIRHQVWHLENLKETTGLSEQENLGYERLKQDYEIHAELVSRMKDEGVTLVAGSDSAWLNYKMGEFTHELEAMKSIGMSDMDVIRSATIHSAESCANNLKCNCNGSVQISSDNFTSSDNCIKLTAASVKDFLTIQPESHLNGQTTYYLLLKKSIKDTIGNEMAADNLSSFATADEEKPIVDLKTPVDSLTNDRTPEFTFESSEAGAVTYSGNCGTIDNTSTVAGGEITVSYGNAAGLSEGLYSNPPPTTCLLYTSPRPRDATLSRMPSSA